MLYQFLMLRQSMQHSHPRTETGLEQMRRREDPVPPDRNPHHIDPYTLYQLSSDRPALWQENILPRGKGVVASLSWKSLKLRHRSSSCALRFSTWHRTDSRIEDPTLQTCHLEPTPQKDGLIIVRPHQREHHDPQTHKIPTFPVWRSSPQNPKPHSPTDEKATAISMSVFEV
jgi:hypothetical protein